MWINSVVELFFWSCHAGTWSNESMAANLGSQAARLAVTMNETMVRFLNLLRLATWSHVEPCRAMSSHLSVDGGSNMWILPTDFLGVS